MCVQRQKRKIRRTKTIFSFFYEIQSFFSTLFFFCCVSLRAGAREMKARSFLFPPWRSALPRSVHKIFFFFSFFLLWLGHDNERMQRSFPFCVGVMDDSYVNVVDSFGVFFVVFVVVKLTFCCFFFSFSNKFSHSALICLQLCLFHIYPSYHLLSSSTSSSSLVLFCAVDRFFEFLLLFLLICICLLIPSLENDFKSQ